MRSTGCASRKGYPALRRGVAPLGLGLQPAASSGGRRTQAVARRASATLHEHVRVSLAHVPCSCRPAPSDSSALRRSRASLGPPGFCVPGAPPAAHNPLVHSPSPASTGEIPPTAALLPARILLARFGCAHPSTCQHSATTPAPGRREADRLMGRTFFLARILLILSPLVGPHGNGQSAVPLLACWRGSATWSRAIPSAWALCGAHRALQASNSVIRAMSSHSIALVPCLLSAKQLPG